MSKTPVKQQSQTQTTDFTPLMLQKSPALASSRNLTGLPRVVKDIVADIYNNVQKWNDYHIRGAKLVKKIGVLVSEEPQALTPALETLTNELYVAVENLKRYSNALDFLASQMSAVVKLEKDTKPLFVSLPTSALADIAIQISLAYKEELKRKENVLENIAFSKNKNEAMFHAGCWTYQQNILKPGIHLKLETLLVETGHRKIS